MSLLCTFSWTVCLLGVLGRAENDGTVSTNNYETTQTTTPTADISFNVTNVRSTLPFENETVCENSSCTTVATIVTTNALNIIMPISNITEATKTNVKKTSFDTTCFCDLKIQFCDINCCCDPECSPDDKLLYDTCQRTNSRSSSSCQLLENFYRSDVADAFWRTDPAKLFCAAKTNLPQQYVHETISKIEDANEAASLMTKIKFGWPKTLSNVAAPLFNVSVRFVFGSNMWVVDKNETLQLFELPSAFVTNSCLIKKPVKFLQNFKSKCLCTDRTSQLVATKTYANLNLVNSSKGTVKVVPITSVRLCTDRYLQDCRNLTSKDESNIVTFIRYDIYHNSSYGITKINLFLVLADPPTLEFAVNFYWDVSKNVNFSQIRSGNPGYIIGKPLLVANAIEHANSTELVRNSTSPLDNFLTFPKNVRGKCVLNNENYLVVHFGYDMLAKCLVKIKYVVEKNESTPDRLCARVQQTIFDHYWSIFNATRLLGAFGNADLSNRLNWLPVLFDTAPHTILNATRGNWTDDRNQTAICYDIATKLRVDVFHAQTLSNKNFERQEKIIGTVFTFEGRKNLSVHITPNGSNYTSVETETEIRQQVSFYRVGRQAIKKFVERPSFKIILPHDFFYPFVKLQSGAANRHTSKLNSAFGIILVILMRFVSS